MLLMTKQHAKAAKETFFQASKVHHVLYRKYFPFLGNRVHASLL